MLMVMPPLTVRDFRIELNYEVADEGELLGNYAFNISQGILQRVSRFIDALARSLKRTPNRGGAASWASATSATS